MHVAVIGAGAIGSMLAVRLAPMTGELTLVARGARLAHLRGNPLRLESNSVVSEARVRACAPDELAAPIDIAIVCTKTPAFADALALLHGRLAPGGIILTTQNGVEAHRIAAEMLPEATVVASRIHGFFEMDGPLVRHVGVEPSLVYGCTHGDPATVDPRMAALFAGSGIAAEPTDRIEQMLWQKFMLAACLGAAALALGVNAGMVCRTAEGEGLLADAMHEVAALARSSGIALDDSDVAQALAFVRSFPPEATTSLQRDVEARRACEYDALPGAVARLAGRCGYAPQVFPRIEGMIRQRGLLP